MKNHIYKAQSFLDDLEEQGPQRKIGQLERFLAWKIKKWTS
jgi:hypothetical protein